MYGGINAFLYLSDDRIVATCVKLNDNFSYNVLGDCVLSFDPIGSAEKIFNNLTFFESKIMSVVEELEYKTNFNINSIYICLPNSFFSFKSSIMDRNFGGFSLDQLNLSFFRKEILNYFIEDKNKLINNKILYYIVDEKIRTTNPIGIDCLKISALSIATFMPRIFANLLNSLSKTSKIKIKSCIPFCHTIYDKFIRDDEMESGCLFLDINYGVTNIQIFHDLVGEYFDSMPIGINMTVIDISKAFNLDIKDAYRVFRMYAGGDDFVNDLNIDISKLKKIVNNSINIFLQKIFLNIKNVMDKKIPISKVIINGKLNGIRRINDIVLDVFNLPCRISDVEKSDLMICHGMVLFFLKNEIEERRFLINKKMALTNCLRNTVDKISMVLEKWF